MMASRIRTVSRDGRLTCAIGALHGWLQEMGNVLVAAGRDLYFQSATLGMEMNVTAIWQYVVQNGPESIFNG